jgi:outer membrane immunogenic protein
MRRFAFAVALLPMIGGVAKSADLPVPPAPMGGWNGFYLGLNAGGGLGNGRSDFAIVGGPFFASVNNSLGGAAIGGAQAGFNWQTGLWVVGLEADIQASGLKGTLSAPCLPAVCGLPLSASYSQSVPWFGTARGRLGIAGAGWLAYATAGYAYGRLDTDASASAGPAAATASLRETRNGWTAGGGIEVMMAGGWTGRLEYLYLDLGRTSTTWTLAGLPGISDDARLTMNVVRVGVNRRF